MSTLSTVRIAVLVLICSIAFLGKLSYSAEETITEDFETLSIGSTTPPAGWSYIDVTGLPNNSYSITNGFAGVGARFTGDNSVNANQPPGC